MATLKTDVNSAMMNQSGYEVSAFNLRQAIEPDKRWKSVRASHDWFWFCFSLVEKMARERSCVEIQRARGVRTRLPGAFELPQDQLLLAQCTSQSWEVFPGLGLIVINCLRYDQNGKNI